MPPTRRTSFRSSFFSPESLRNLYHILDHWSLLGQSVVLLVVKRAYLRQLLQGPRVFWTKCSTNDSNLAFVKRMLKCLGPVLSAVIKGKETSVAARPSSSLFAFSAASLNLCIARVSLLRSRPDSFLNSPSKKATRTSSKSSPPRRVSPLVAFTSKTPPLISRIEISNVPPPRSKTVEKFRRAFSRQVRNVAGLQCQVNS